MRAFQIRRSTRSVSDPRPYGHLLRLVHFYNYTFVAERRRMAVGAGCFISPKAYFTNGERISIGDGSHIGARCMLWAGRDHGRIELGHHVLLGPGVVMTVSNYDFDAGSPTMDQATVEHDIVVGDDVWLGANVVVLAGVRIGDGCVVGAGSVVTRDLPAGVVAVGNPARLLRYRAGHEPSEEPPA